MGKNEKILSWDAFQQLGNPDQQSPKDGHDQEEADVDYDSVIRVWLDRKSRGGKTACLIKGIDSDEMYLKALGKTLKTKCGVGGSVKNGIIIIQGDHRDKIIQYLKDEGFNNVKAAGS